jgi:GrpB-like predicted nucleotidyltransferase (UPF0157 family)
MSDEHIGLARNTVRVVPYDPVWPRLFDAERQRVVAALGELARGIEHYGSTSIEGMPAKPIIDILVGVDSLDCLEAASGPLVAIGYEHLHWVHVPGHHIFGKGEIRTHLLHLVEITGPNWHENLKFRDALRDDTELAAEYIALKEALAVQYPNDRRSYNAAKGTFIQRIREA